MLLRLLSCLGLAVHTSCAASASSVADESCSTTAPGPDRQPPAEAVLLQTMTVKHQTNSTVASTLAAEDRPDKKPHGHQGRSKKNGLVVLVADQAKHGAGAQAERVSLSEAGYREIAALKDHDEMAAFVTRVADELGYEISSPGKLSGAVPYYSGHKAKQTFKALKAEIIKTAGWSEPAHPSASLASFEADADEEDEEEQADEDEVEDEVKEDDIHRSSKVVKVKEEKSKVWKSSPSHKAPLSAGKALKEPHGKSKAKHAKKAKPAKEVPYSRPMSTSS